MTPPPDSEYDFDAWINTRVGRVTFELFHADQRDLIHAAFMEGMQSKGLQWDAHQLVQSPDIVPQMVHVRDEATLHRTYLATLLAARVDPAHAIAMTMAYIQARGMAVLKPVMPPDESEDWQR